MHNYHLRYNYTILYEIVRDIDTIVAGGSRMLRLVLKLMKTEVGKPLVRLMAYESHEWPLEQPSLVHNECRAQCVWYIDDSMD